jgi:spermidine/putrescine transport system permease protein
MSAGASVARRGSLRRRPVGLAAYYVALITLLYLPIGILALFSLNSGTSLVLPLRGLTLTWYGKVFESPALLRSVVNSLTVAVVSSVAATILGTMVAVLLARYRFRVRRLLIGLAVLPLIVPFVVLAVALLVLFRAFNVELSLTTVAIAHTIVALPYTLLIVVARLTGFDASLEDAAMDLGASYPTTLRLIVLPIIAPAIVSAALTAFTISFDEFALALFLAGKNPTFPVYLFGQLRFANTLPIIIALAVLLMIATLGLIAVADRVRRAS